MINILVLEDEMSYFSQLTENLKHDFGSQVTICPSIADESETFYSWSWTCDHLRGQINSGNEAQLFSEIAAFAADTKIDVFIIDNRLYDGSSKDDTGLKLVSYLHEQKVPPVRLILLTNDDEQSRGFSNLDGKAKLVNKGAGGALNRYLIENFDLKLKKDHWRAFRGLLENSELKSVHSWLRILVYLSLAFGILATALQMAVSLHLLWGDAMKHFSPPDSGPVMDNKHKVVLQFLVLAEGVFLNFLPFFILIGFLSYAKYLRGILTGNKRDKVPEEALENSTAVLKLSKILFVSSMMATLILTMIGWLVDHEIDIEFFLAAVILLVLLLFYWFMLEKLSHEKEHPHTGK